MYEYRAFVRKVYDGDTVTVDIDLGFDVVLQKQKIRLLRINAPEVRGEQRQEGLKSRDALRESWKQMGKDKDTAGQERQVRSMAWRNMAR